MAISFCLALPRIRNPRAAEIERITFLVEHHFHHVRTGKRLRIVNRVAGRGNAGLLLLAQDIYDFGYKRRLDQRLVALQVDDDVVVSEHARDAVRDRIREAVGPADELARLLAVDELALA